MAARRDGPARQVAVDDSAGSHRSDRSRTRPAAARRRRWLRVPAYALVSVLLIGITALTASADVRAAAARWALDVTAPAAAADAEGGAAAAPDTALQAARGLASDDPALRDPPRDARACNRIARAARRQRADELTLHGYTAELRRAADGAVRGGDVRRHTRALLDAIGTRDARSERRARAGLIDACALAAALTAG